MKGLKSILIVEDDPAVRRLLHQVVEREGYEVVSLSTAQEALRHSRESQSKMDILICDQVLPDMRGPELVSRLKAERPKMKVVIITGYLEAEIPTQMDAFLQKPFSPRQLLDQIARLQPACCEEH